MVEFFQKTFGKIDLNIFFLTNVDIINLFTEKKLVQQIYTAVLVLILTKKVKIIDKIPSNLQAQY